VAGSPVVNKPHSKESIMRCLACNKNLNDYESTRKHAITGAYLDLCNGCFAEVSSMADVPVNTREDLANCGDIEESIDNDQDSLYNVLYSEDNIKE
jgi:hypothetical protein